MSDQVHSTGGFGVVQSVPANLAFASGGELVEVLAAVASTHIKVLAAAFSADAGGICQIKSGATVIARWNFGANGQLVLPFNPAGWCTTAAAAALNCTHSATGNIRGVFVVELIEADA